MKNQKGILVSIICVSVICCVMVAGMMVKTFYADVHRASWQVHGTWITDDGELQDTVEFGVKARVVDYRSNTEWDTVKFECAFPDDFQYHINAIDPHYFSHTGIMGKSYFGSICSARDLENNGHSCPSFFALDLENGYVLLKFGRENTPTLVASMDPVVSPQEILEHFDGYQECWDIYYD